MVDRIAEPLVRKTAEAYPDLSEEERRRELFGFVERMLWDEPG